MTVYLHCAFYCLMNCTFISSNTGLQHTGRRERPCVFFFLSLYIILTSNVSYFFKPHSTQPRVKLVLKTQVCAHGCHAMCFSPRTHSETRMLEFNLITTSVLSFFPFLLPHAVGALCGFVPLRTCLTLKMFFPWQVAVLIAPCNPTAATVTISR